MNNGKTFSGYKWFSVLNEREVPEKITGTEPQQDVYTMFVAAMKKDPGVAKQILDHYTKDPEYKTLLLTGIYGLPDISLKALNRPPKNALSGIHKKYLTGNFREAPAAPPKKKSKKEKEVENHPQLDFDNDDGYKPVNFVISADDFNGMFKELWLKYVKQGETLISQHIIEQHAYNTLISVIGFTILQHDQISQIPGETFTMLIAGKKVALSPTGAGQSGQSWKNVKNLYDKARAQTNPAMFDNVLGNIKAIMQKYTQDIFDTQKDLDSEFDTQVTASAEYVMKSLDALKFGKGSTPGLSDTGALYLYHVLTYPLVEADETIYINHSESCNR